MQPNRRQGQFSIKTLAGVMALVSGLFGLATWIGWIGSLLVFSFVTGVAVGARGIVQGRRVMVAIGVCLVAGPLCILWYDVANTVVYEGEWLFMVDCTVIDAETEQPIPHVKGVLSFNDSTDLTFPGIQIGRSTMCFDARWPSSLRVSKLGITHPRRPVVIDLTQFAIFVRADGYRPKAVPLNLAVGAERPPSSAKFFRAKVALRKEGSRLLRRDPVN